MNSKRETVSRVCRGLVVGLTLTALLPSQVLAHGIGHTNTRISMEPASLMSMPTPGMSVSNLKLRDTSPAYTWFTSATCGAPLPAGITGCSVTQQSEPGAAGAIE